MSYLLNNPNEIKRIGRNAKKFVKEYHDSEKISGKYVCFIENYTLNNPERIFQILESMEEKISNSNKENKDVFLRDRVFKIMERRLYFYIMYPAMLLSWIFGVSIIHFQGIELLKAKWFLIKIIAVIILTGYHFYLGHCLRIFNQDMNISSSKFFRIINEIPTVLLILIVFLAILKPM